MLVLIFLIISIFDQFVILRDNWFIKCACVVPDKKLFDVWEFYY